MKTAAKFDADEFERTIREQAERVSKPKAERKTNRRNNGDASEHIQQLPPPQVPMAVARLFVSERCVCDGVPTLRHWRGGFWEWRKAHWREIEGRTVRSALYAFTENAAYIDDKRKPTPWA